LVGLVGFVKFVEFVEFVGLEGTVPGLFCSPSHVPNFNLSDWFDWVRQASLVLFVRCKSSPGKFSQPPVLQGLRWHWVGGISKGPPGSSQGVVCDFFQRSNRPIQRMPRRSLQSEAGPAKG